MEMSLAYNKILKKRKEFWNTYFEKYESVIDEKDFTLDEVIDALDENVSTIPRDDRRKKKSKDLNLSLPVTFNVRKETIVKSKFNKSIKVSKQRSICRNTFYNCDDTKTIKSLTKGSTPIKTLDNCNLSYEKDNSKDEKPEIYKFLKNKFKDDIEIEKFMFVKNTIEDNSNIVPDNFLKNDQMRKEKISELAKRLIKDDILKYIRSYFEYIDFLQKQKKKEIDETCETISSTSIKYNRTDEAKKQHSTIQKDNDRKSSQIYNRKENAIVTKNIDDVEGNKHDMKNIRSKNPERNINNLLTKLQNKIVSVCMTKEDISLHFLGISGINLNQFLQMRNIVDNDLKSDLEKKIYVHVSAKMYCSDCLWIQDHCNKAVLEEIKTLIDYFPRDQLLKYVKYHILCAKHKINYYFRK